MPTRAALVACSALLLACSGFDRNQSSQIQAEEAAISDLFDEYLAAFHAEDTTRLKSLYTDDAVLLPPGPRVVEGIQSIIQEWYQPMFSEFAAELSLTAQETHASGSWGFTRGTYLFRLHSADGAPSFEERGKYIDVIRKGDDGRWKIARAIHNTDRP